MINSPDVQIKVDIFVPCDKVRHFHHVICKEPSVFRQCKCNT